MPSPIPVRGPLKMPSRKDLLVTAAIAVLTACMGLFGRMEETAHRPDAVGWVLLTVMVGVLAWRRHYPMAVLVALIAAETPYHLMNNMHTAPTPASVAAVYSLAVAGPRLRTVLTIGGLVALVAGVMTSVDAHKGVEMIRTSGWVIAVALLGEAVRVHRNYIGAIVERAERAERTREETAARRVAEERLRIARDLHDLLAHSITLIGVQTSVAAHLVVADPGRLDRAALAEALDGIAGTCRDARADLRTTLQVLRAGDTGDGTGPPPGMQGLEDLAEAAEAGGAKVTLTVDDAAYHRLPPAAGAAAYRIVQQSLTNAVQHAGPGVEVRVDVTYDADADALGVAVTDDGPAEEPPQQTAGPPRAGYGIVGMRERARSVGGSFEAGPRDDGPGFAVRATLPCAPDDRGAGPATDPAGTALWRAAPDAGPEPAPQNRPGSRREHRPQRSRST